MSRSDLPGARIAERLCRAPGESPALVPYLVSGAPAPERFRETLLAAAAEADVLELGLPFSDPVADGPTIANVGRRALERGVTLGWVLEQLHALPERPAAPLVLMTYLNPLLARGLPATVRALAAAGIEGLIVPDLPLEESQELRDLGDEAGVALIQLVSPTTSLERVPHLCRASRGFVYAVARTGITGGATSIEAARAHLRRVRDASALPVAAGFGIRSAHQVQALTDVVDGAVVGTALVEALEAGVDAGDFLRGLRAPATSPALASPSSNEASR